MTDDALSIDLSTKCLCNDLGTCHSTETAQKVDLNVLVETRFVSISCVKNGTAWRQEVCGTDQIPAYLTAIK